MAKKTKALRRQQQRKRVALQSSRRVAVAKTAAIKRQAVAKEAEPLPEGPWYIAQVCGGREITIGAELKKRKIPFWFPMESFEVKGEKWTWDPFRGAEGAWRSRFVWESVTQPLLRGYLFVALQQDEWHLAVKTIPGVVRILGESDTTQEGAGKIQAAVLRHIHRLRDQACAGDFNHVPEVVEFEDGETVRIAKGVCRGFEVVIQSKGEDEVRVLLSMFGRESVMTVAPDDLEKVQKAA